MLSWWDTVICFILALDTCSHIADLERTKHGIFTKADALDMSDITMDNVRHAISKAAQQCNRSSSFTSPNRDGHRSR